MDRSMRRYPQGCPGRRAYGQAVFMHKNSLFNPKNRKVGCGVKLGSEGTDELSKWDAPSTPQTDPEAGCDERT